MVWSTLLRVEFGMESKDPKIEEIIKRWLDDPLAVLLPNENSGLTLMFPAKKEAQDAIPERRKETI